jgi:hypothetical protein
MSCRIDRVLSGDDVVVLSVSGRITEQDVQTLATAIEAETRAAVAINLEHVDLIDREAVKFLAQEELEGTVLRNCSAYIREWVTKERTEMVEKGGDTEDA